LLKQVAMNAGFLSGMDGHVVSPGIWSDTTPCAPETAAVDSYCLGNGL
jgi:hypothetical protein